MAFALDIQTKWLPKEFLQTIPRSTYHGWKQDEKDKFIGYEYASSIGDKVEDLKLFYDEKVTREKQLFIAYTKIKLTILNIIGRDQLKNALKENYTEVLRVIEGSKNTIKGGVKTICSFLDINIQSYTYWKTISKYKCENSALGVCIKKVLSQASFSEIDTMKRLLNRTRFAHWPICSVWGYAMRKGHTMLSLDSWYRYNQKFKFREKVKKGRYKKVYDPITAPNPNHTWHADITIVKTLDNVKHYVYLIVDNFSKYIINWKVSDKCNGEIRTQTIREAVLQEFGEDLTATQQIDLIVDGGTENNNKTVEQFIKESQVDITKKIALKDIVQSNSMVEASNKILKHRYLFKQPISNREHLEEHLKSAIDDYCNHRPHYALGIYTPYEIQYDKKPELNIKTVKNAVKERRETNKMNGCTQKCD
jgi:putative transposase